MEHLDEGTIHAWLDGALPDADGARVQSHVAGCAGCAAAVAEARGFIAASSRILSALDHVPGGVIPTTATGAVAAATTGAASSALPGGEVPEIAASRGVAEAPAVAAASVRALRSSPRRPWYRRPQWAAAAGISFLAVALSVVWQRSGAPSVGSLASESMRATPIVPADVSVATDSVGSSVAETSALAEQSPSATAAAKAAPSVAQSNEMKRSAASNAGPARASAAKASSAEASAAEASAVGATALADRTASLAQADRQGSRADARGETRAAPVPAAPRMAVQPVPAEPTSAKVAKDTTEAGRPLALSADAIVRNESARIAGERDAQRKATAAVAGRSATAGAATAQRERAPDPTAAVGSIVGCYRLAPQGVGRALEVGDLLQLEGGAAGSDAARPAFVARDLTAAPAAAAGARGALRWTLVAQGQVTLVRGEGEGARRLTIEVGEASGDAPAAGAMRAVRVPCPAR